MRIAAKAIAKFVTIFGVDEGDVRKARREEPDGPSQHRKLSDVAGVATKTVAGVVSQADIFDIRRIETQVLIPSGNTLVMGGLISDTTAVGNIKVPILGDIPFLGHLFRQETKTQDKKNLIIFITPTIVQSEDYQPTQTDFLKTKAPSENSSDFGAWDSGK